MTSNLPDPFEAQVSMLLRMVVDELKKVETCSSAFRQKPYRMEYCTNKWIEYFRNSPQIKGFKDCDESNVPDPVKNHRLGLLYVFNDTIQKVRVDDFNSFILYKEYFLPKVLEACAIQSKDQNKSTYKKWTRTIAVLHERKCLTTEEYDKFLRSLNGKEIDVSCALKEDMELDDLPVQDVTQEISLISDIIELSKDCSDINVKGVVNELDKKNRLRECKIRKQCLGRCLEILEYFDKRHTTLNKDDCKQFKENIGHLLSMYNSIEGELFLYGNQVSSLSSTSNYSLYNTDSSSFQSPKQDIFTNQLDSSSYDYSNKTPENDRKEPFENSNKSYKDNDKNFYDRRKIHNNNSKDDYPDSRVRSRSNYDNNHFYKKSIDGHSSIRRKDDYSRSSGYNERNNHHRDRNSRKYSGHKRSRTPDRYRSGSRSPNHRHSFHYVNKQR
uniref:CID domain-containing protein n=1 Tax=Parastrongyloides trichosuri TaxID=131310 RepID=A0A0N4ZUJ7_PARTI